MNTLILYASKHGATGEIARRIARKLEGATLYDLKEGNIPPLGGYDRIVIGSALYAGMILKEAKEFLSQNADALRDKKLGLFLCGMDASREAMYFDSNFPHDLLDAASEKRHLGGIFDPKKAGLMGRLIMKAVAKQSGYKDSIDDEQIQQFAEGLKA